MKRIISIAAIGALALAVPVLADDAQPNQTPSAQQQCRTERAQMGKATFAQTYGTNHGRRNAFGKCVSKRTTATDADAQQANTNASQQCRAERSADPAAFAAKYGTNKNGKNAFGRCVSQKSSAMTETAANQQVSADVGAARDCRAERKADPAAFTAKYGTNHNGRNAFGKCVSQKAKAQQDQQDQQDQQGS